MISPLMKKLLAMALILSMFSPALVAIAGPASAATAPATLINNYLSDMVAQQNAIVADQGKIVTYEKDEKIQLAALYSQTAAYKNDGYSTAKINSQSAIITDSASVKAYANDGSNVYASAGASNKAIETDYRNIVTVMNNNQAALVAAGWTAMKFSSVQSTAQTYLDNGASDYAVASSWFKYPPSQFSGKTLVCDLIALSGVVPIADASSLMATVLAVFGIGCSL